MNQAFLKINYQGSPFRKRSRNYMSSFPRITSHLNPDKSVLPERIQINEIPMDVDGLDTEIKSLLLPVHDITDEQQIRRIVYLNSGDEILALLSNCVHLVWKWMRNGDGKVTTMHPPHLLRPTFLNFMANDRCAATWGDDVSSLALSNDDTLLCSLSGSRVFLFNLSTLEKKEWLQSSSAVTSIAIHPDASLLALGKANSTVEILNDFSHTRVEIKGHSKSVTGLAFSEPLKALISTGADNQIIVWNIENWMKISERFLEIPSDRAVSASSKTEIEIHKDGIQLLVVHETQLAIFNAKKLQSNYIQWMVGSHSAPIHSATFSCDGQLIYSAFRNGDLRIFRVATFTIQVLYSLTGSDYVPNFDSSEWYRCAPVVAAAKHDPYQFAVGLANGNVIVIEPSSAECKWDIDALDDAS